MAIVVAKTRLPARVAALAVLSSFALLAFAGAHHTVMVLNRDKAGALAQQSAAEAERQRAIAAIETKQLEIEKQAELAKSYSELGLRQATCGDTLARFYFQPGMDLTQQLTTWGFDWGAPQYNEDQWQPLFDSAGLLFAAIRRDPATGQQAIVSVDRQALDQASICSLNQLSQNQP